MSTIQAVRRIQRIVAGTKTQTCPFVAALLIGAASLAYASPTLAAGTAEQRAACMSDAFRVCGSEIPNVERITACMKKNVAQLSPGCRAQFKS